MTWEQYRAWVEWELGSPLDDEGSLIETLRECYDYGASPEEALKEIEGWI
jgi:predicted RNase H-like HicB family nuclease